MEKKVFCASYSDLIKFNRKPNEDFYLVSDKYPIFIVADGVTQACHLDGEYAYPQGAKDASQILCKTTIKELEAYLATAPLSTEKEILALAFDKANEEIKKLNIESGIAEKYDYYINDLFDTVGVVGILSGDILHYGFIGDCGLAIFDKDNKIKFQTIDTVELARESARAKYPQWKNLDFKERNIIMHREFRNSYSGLGYGSFSGEEAVRNYYNFGEIKLKEGDLAVFYSDGFVKHLKFADFIAILRNQDKNELDRFVIQKAESNSDLCGTDRTFISFVF